MAEQKQILVVEDNAQMGQEVVRLLHAEGFAPRLAATLRDAKTHLNQSHVDLVVLDINLPDGTGFQLCRDLREEDATLPVLFLTDRTDEESVVKGLSFATTDYLRKPFSGRELVVRVRKLMREVTGSAVIGDLVVNHDERRVKWRGKPLPLSPREYDLMSQLASSAGKLVTREKLLEHCGDSEVMERSINSYLSRLKAKLSAAGVTGIKITSVYGEGYRLEKE